MDLGRSRKLFAAGGHVFRAGLHFRDHVDERFDHCAQRFEHDVFFRPFGDFDAQVARGELAGDLGHPVLGGDQSGNGTA